jgi:hypothetical protein
LLLCCRLDIPSDLVAALIASPNAHIRSLVVAGYADGRIARRPKLSLGNKLPSTDQNWLLKFQARSVGFSKGSFSGSMSAEFEHLATRKVVLIDI